MATEIETLVGEGKFDKAIALLDSMIAASPLNDSLYFQRGKILWKKGDIPAAMNDYSKAAHINPQSPAAIALEHANDVQQFFNPDILNP